MLDGEGREVDVADPVPWISVRRESGWHPSALAQTALAHDQGKPVRLRELARPAEGTYGKLLARMAKTDLLLLDDWGLVPIAEPQRRDLYEILEDRSGLRSTIVTSQYPVESWHELLGEPTLADAILDRLIHGAYRIALTGDSMRKGEP